MKLITDKGEFVVNWIGGPSSRFNTVLIDTDDDRSLWEIARDYSGLSRIEYQEPHSGHKIVLEGYSQVAHVSRMDMHGPAQITLAKGE